MIPQKVAEVLRRFGLEAMEFAPGSTPTAETAAAQVGVAVGQIAKSILLAGKDGRYRMAILPGDRRISSSAFKRLTGVKNSMASAEDTFNATGFRPGGVCPFGVPSEVEIFIDTGLGRFPTIYPAAGTDASAVPITFDRLVAVTGGRAETLTE